MSWPCRSLFSRPQNLRAIYDKNGKKRISKEDGVNVEDAASFFANVFGGERFMDYVRTPHCFLSLAFSQDQGLIDVFLRPPLFCRLERSR